MHTLGGTRSQHTYMMEIYRLIQINVKMQLDLLFRSQELSVCR